MTTANSIIEECRRILEELYDDKADKSATRTIKLLSDFRILTREKTLTTDIINDRCLNTLVAHASDCQIEAQKCLSNLILNYAHVREYLVEPYVDCVEARLHKLVDESNVDEITSVESRDNKCEQQYCEVLYYDLRILFLLSALCSGSRPKIRDRLLSLLLKVTFKEAKQFRKDNYLLVLESLKTLFNLTMDKCFDIDLVSLLIIQLFTYVHTEAGFSAASNDDGSIHDHADQLLVNLIHLLTNMPKEVYLRLSDEDVNKVLNHLDEQLKTFSKNSFRDTVLPVLNTCANICRYKEDVRQRWFQDIIGSTKDFEKRPEEYDTLRGRLVKLMTSVDVHIKDIAAEFLHALCGGDTEKFITYTGFGNSAAFLSTRGLLSQNSRRDVPSNGGDQTQGRQSSSEQEYLDLRGKLDPITGRLDQPRRNPMDGMTEDEKEWHAHELAGAIAKLSNLGVMKPMQVGDDGQLKELQLKQSCEVKHDADNEDSD